MLQGVGCGDWPGLSNVNNMHIASRRHTEHVFPYFNYDTVVWSNLATLKCESSDTVFE